MITVPRLLLLLLIVLTLGGCGGTTTLPGTDGVSVDTSDGEVTIEGEAGTVSGGTGKLPSGFPSDDVPLVEGDVQSGMAIDQAEQKGWSVVLLVAEPDHAAAVSLLTDAGFVQAGEFSAGGSEASQLTSRDWDVLVSTSTAGGTATVTYTVAPVASA